MSYPTKRLTALEEVRLDVHPHWSALFSAAWPVALVALVNIVAAASGWLNWRAAPALELAVWTFALVYAAVKVASYYATDFVVTTSRIIFRHGLLVRRNQEIPLASISNTTLTQSLLERVLANGTIVVESAGTNSRETFADIAHTEAVLQLIHQLSEDRVTSTTASPVPPAPVGHDGRPPLGTASATSATSHRDLAGQLERLSQLHVQGHLDDVEFAAAKAALLRQF